MPHTLTIALGRAYQVEFGSPAELLSNPDGVFSSMVENTGEQNATFLRDVVR